MSEQEGPTEVQVNAAVNAEAESLLRELRHRSDTINDLAVMLIERDPKADKLRQVYLSVLYSGRHMMEALEEEYDKTYDKFEERAIVKVLKVALEIASS